MTKKVTIVTLTYNNCEKSTKPYLESLYKYTDEALFDLIIVENGSTDETKDLLEQWKKKKSNIQIIYNTNNKGYSYGNNQGIELAKTPFVALLNNDILFTPNWLENSLKIYSEKENVGLVSPTVINDHEHLHINKNNYLKYVKNHDQLEYCKVLYVQFSCVLIPRYVIDKVGLLDTNYTPAWYEDDDYSFRTVMAGFNNYSINNVLIFHNHSTTSNQLPDKNMIMDKNQEYYFSKHFLAEYTWKITRENKILKNKLNNYKKNIFIRILYGIDKYSNRIIHFFINAIKKQLNW